MPHTPGPWDKSNNYITSAVNNELICTCNSQTNADLIAAAPELLETCKAIVELDKDLVFPEVTNKAKQAINKAEGTTNK
ncbi:MAG: hypothetical protein GY820_38665 [Gammaproteobacteria bacterium]|nr:hypothetical protein [Gammaproteobacteria bacterium]